MDRNGVPFFLLPCYFHSFWKRERGGGENCRIYYTGLFDEITRNITWYGSATGASQQTTRSVTFALHVAERCKYVTVLRAKNLAGGFVRGDTKITTRKRWGRLWFPLLSLPFAFRDVEITTSSTVNASSKILSDSIDKFALLEFIALGFRIFNFE